MLENRLTKLLKQNFKDLLTVYFTAGYPNLIDTEKIILSLDEAGVHIIEVGIPYSDPLADGPVIQESGMEAIENGMSLHVLFKQLEGIRTRTQVPLILMGYFNQLLQFGVDKFLDACVKTGIDGLIIPDLPLFEYEKFYKQKLEERNISISFLITPQTDNQRINLVDNLSTGFIYVVSDSSITGVKSGISPQQITYFERIKSLKLSTPQLIGFGISDNKSFRTACKYASGAIIGSAFIRHLKGSSDVTIATLEFVKSIFKA